MSVETVESAEPAETTETAAAGPGDGLIDTHVHLWDPALLRYRWLEGTPLHRRYDAADYLAAAPGAAGVVLVQADCEPDQTQAEVDWLSTQADRLPGVLGIVAHTPLHRGRSAVAALDRLTENPLVVGVRRLLQDEPPGSLQQRGFRDGLSLLSERGLPFDLCVRSPQLSEAADLVKDHPDVRFVLDHLGKPRVGADPGRWRSDLSRLAAAPNVYCKLSGLTSEVVAGPAGTAGVGPYLRHAVAEFGLRRCLFGSDWPLVQTESSHPDWARAVIDAVGDPAARDVLNANAATVYHPRRHHEHEQGPGSTAGYETAMTGGPSSLPGTTEKERR